MKSPFEIFRGPLLRVLSDHAADFHIDGLVVLRRGGTGDGRIEAVGPTDQVANHLGWAEAELPAASDQLLLPAFFDTHFHWVQDAVRSLPKASLLEWLERYTFPEEAKYGDGCFAREQARSFWGRILGLGTIGGMCYGSIHEVALEAAMDQAPEDFRIGDVSMTMHCPDYICQQEGAAIAAVQAGAERYGRRYVCSPRFAPTTGPAVMQAAARTAALHGCFIQTHLGETLREIEWVKGIYREMPGFEDVDSYTEIYRRVGLLGPRTIFGHCIHLSDTEWRMLAESGSRIASCPTSNAPVEESGLGSGLFDFEQAEAHGVDWSLASDIGGGPFLSMFDVMDSFVRQNRRAGRDGASFVKALHRATRMGAELMDLGPDRGRLDAGAYFDAIRVAMPEGDFRNASAETVLSALHGQMAGREASETMVMETYVRGQRRFKREALA